MIVGILSVLVGGLIAVFLLHNSCINYHTDRLNGLLEAAKYLDTKITNLEAIVKSKIKE